MVELICVSPFDVEKVWPHVEGMLRSAIERTNLDDFSDIEAGLFTGSLLLWLAWSGEKIEALAVSQLVKSGDGKSCIIVACSGQDMERWLPLVNGIEKYAADEGCSSMRIYGRKGWERVLNGYRADHVILRKPL